MCIRDSPADRLRGGEEVHVLRVGAGPAALDVRHPVLVEHPGDPELVGEREDDVLALGPITEGRVVEDDRRGGGTRVAGGWLWCSHGSVPSVSGGSERGGLWRPL